MSNTLFDDFEELVADNLAALVCNPDSLTVGLHQNPNREGELIVDIVAPRSEIAMIVGKSGETVKALHRVFLCQARNWGLVPKDGTLALSWDPSDR